MFDENIDGVRFAQRPHIANVNAPVPRHIAPQPLQRSEGHTVFRGTTGIGGIVYIATLTGDDAFGNLLDSLHSSASF